MPEAPPPKPLNENWRPELTRLPELTPKRLRSRQLWQRVARFLIRTLTRTKVFGLENFPLQGPVLVVTNHLGDADIFVGLAYLPVAPDALAKAELYDMPVLGKWMDAYGVIWVHRGQPDRRALRAALQGLAEGRMVGLAPEARQSITGSLEQGTEGAAFLAIKAGAMRNQPIPLVPVVFTGTENAQVYGSWRRLRRGFITMTVGKPFYLTEATDSRQAISQGTEQIMHALANLLPAEYQGVYAS